ISCLTPPHGIQFSTRNAAAFTIEGGRPCGEPSQILVRSCRENGGRRAARPALHARIPSSSPVSSSWPSLRGLESGLCIKRARRAEDGEPRRGEDLGVSRLSP